MKIHYVFSVQSACAPYAEDLCQIKNYKNNRKNGVFAAGQGMKSLAGLRAHAMGAGQSPAVLIFYRTHVILNMDCKYRAEIIIPVNN